MSINAYIVIVESFSERHFIKSFKKKYKNAWDITWRSQERLFQSFDVLFDSNIAETIIDSLEIKICKTEFTVAGTNISRHASGNRCIVALHKTNNSIRVLLVYNKTDLGGHNETAEWKKIVKDNYPEYRDLL